MMQIVWQIAWGKVFSGPTVITTSINIEGLSNDQEANLSEIGKENKYC